MLTRKRKELVFMIQLIDSVLVLYLHRNILPFICKSKADEDVFQNMIYQLQI
jgi:hypothetical protein